MKTYAENKKARFDYEILEKFQAGLVLNGQEVKSIQSGRIQLAGSYVVTKGQELYLLGAVIPPYQPNNAPDDYNPERSRKLLMKKEEIRYLLGKVKERGLTLIPLRVYNRKAKLNPSSSGGRGWVKLEFGLGKGKKDYDKREKLKKREAVREMERALKRGAVEL